MTTNRIHPVLRGGHVERARGRMTRRGTASASLGRTRTSTRGGCYAEVEAKVRASKGVEREKSSVTTPGLAGWSQAATILCTGSRTCGGAQPNADNVDPGFALLLEEA